MKKYFVLALLLSAILIGCTQETPTPKQQTATAYFSIGDPGLSLDNVTAIQMTVSKITLHKQETDTWIDVMSTENTFDLMQLKADQVNELVGMLNLTPGTYNQVRLDVSKVMVTYNGVAQEAKLPSNVLKVNVDMKTTNETVLVNLDFKAEESLHITGDNRIIMTPVINVQKFSGATVQKQGKNIAVTKSRAKTEETVGMDQNGNIGKDNTIPAGKDLETDETGKVVVKEPTPAEPEIPKGTGHAVFTVKDKNDKNDTNTTDNSTKSNTTRKDNTTGNPSNGTKASGLNVTSLTVTISNLSIHRADDNASSWISVDIQPLTVDLLQLQDIEAVLGEMNLEPGQYNQIRLEVSNAMANVNGQDVNVTIPSGTLKLVGVMKILEGNTSLATMDFQVDKSFHKSGARYTFRPVIKLTTRTSVTVTERHQKEKHEEISYEGGNVTEDKEITT